MRLDLTWMDGVRRDTAYAARSLAKSRGFTAAAVLTLAIGIGATTAICSIVNTPLFARQDRHPLLHSLGRDLKRGA